MDFLFLMQEMFFGCIGGEFEGGVCVFVCVCVCAEKKLWVENKQRFLRR